MSYIMSVSSEVPQEMAAGEDRLTRLIRQQFPIDPVVSTIARTLCQSRIAEIFTKLAYDQVEGIQEDDVNNGEQREVVYQMLARIYAPFEADLAEGRLGSGAMYSMWKDLHNYLMENGFNIENVNEFIRMYLGHKP